ncbi:MAG: alpha/beta fold hydrolase [Actinomycetes bacterium]
MTHFALKDELLDAQTLRAAGAAAYGGADIGEVLATARLVNGANLDSWYEQWTTTGQRVLALAREQESDGNRESARLAYWRASTYLRTAGVMLMGTPVDSRFAESMTAQRQAFRAGAELMDHSPQVVHIPFEGGSLPGYFFAVDSDPRPRATVILIGGYDSTVEESYFFNGAAALARGYNALMFDGPGQGAALVDQGLLMRPDWENVLPPVVDFLLTRPDVDPARLALIGLSLGAYLAPRAASGEHRLAACIADCGAYDLFDAFLDRLPKPLRSGVESDNHLARKTIADMLTHAAKEPTAGWSLRRGMAVHGAADPMALVMGMREYTLKGFAERITCPTFVCNAEGDDISASAPRLVAALTCEHEFVTFTSAEGAGDHCESGARLLYHARSFGWLDALLRPTD